MREIKFRAWDTENKIMTNEVFLNEDGFFIRHSGHEWAGNYIEVMQYTGLKDKNSKEIYEGDIIKTDESMASGYGDNNIGVIQYAQELLMPKFWIRCKGLGCQDISGGGDLEIIGNIYENPELLK